MLAIPFSVPKREEWSTRQIGLGVRSDLSSAHTNGLVSHRLARSKVLALVATARRTGVLPQELQHRFAGSSVISSPGQPRPAPPFPQYLNGNTLWLSRRTGYGLSPPLSESRGKPIISLTQVFPLHHPRAPDHVIRVAADVPSAHDAHRLVQEEKHPNHPAGGHRTVQCPQSSRLRCSRLLLVPISFISLITRPSMASLL